MDINVFEDFSNPDNYSKLPDSLRISTMTATSKINTTICLSKLFEYIKGDKDSIMGLPIKQIINYIKQFKK